jgi:hypothetical protein
MHKQCQICDGRIESGVAHVHRDPCDHCGKPDIWCHCEAKPHGKATTAEGEEVFLMSIATISPIAFASEAREISAAFLNSRGLNELAANMLPIALRPMGGGEVSHVICERLVYTDEARDQLQWLGTSGFSWASGVLHQLTDDPVVLKSMLVTIKSNDGAGVLECLGLEEVP